MHKVPRRFTIRGRYVVFAFVLFFIGIVGYFFYALHSVSEYYSRTWRRGLMQLQRQAVYGAYEYHAQAGNFPRTYLLVPEFIDGTETYSEELKLAGLTKENIAFGQVSADRHSESDEIIAEVARIEPVVPRWEQFGPMIFLISDEMNSMDDRVPVAITYFAEQPPEIGVVYRDVMYRMLNPQEIQPLVIDPISSHNLPPLPDSFLSRLPQ